MKGFVRANVKEEKMQIFEEEKEEDGEIDAKECED